VSSFGRSGRASAGDLAQRPDQAQHVLEIGAGLVVLGKNLAEFGEGFGVVGAPEPLCQLLGHAGDVGNQRLVSVLVLDGHRAPCAKE
jgi:hypothetical protein